MITYIPPDLFEINFPENDPRSFSFIKDVKDSIDPEFIQYSDRRILRLYIQAKSILLSIYQKYFINPNQLGLFDENSMRQMQN